MKQENWIWELKIWCAASSVSDLMTLKDTIDSQNCTYRDRFRVSKFYFCFYELLACYILHGSKENWELLSRLQTHQSPTPLILWEQIGEDFAVKSRCIIERWRCIHINAYFRWKFFFKFQNFQSPFFENETLTWLYIIVSIFKYYVIWNSLICTFIFHQYYVCNFRKYALNSNLLLDL